MSEKTYVFNEPTPGYGNGFGNGMWGGDGIWAILLLALFGRNGFGGFGGNGGQIPEILSGDAGRELLMSAIQGNGQAISQLATTLNCDINALRTSLEGIDRSVCQVGNQVGMTGMQVVNAIQSGNSALSAQFAECCCATQNAILTQGYENRLADCQQTNALTNTMNSNTLQLRDSNQANTNAILARIDNMERSQLIDKIDKLREEKSTLITEVSQRNQNEYFASLINPINAELARLRCKEVPTYAQPYMPGIPTTTFTAPLCGYGAYGAGFAAGEAATV